MRVLRLIGAPLPCPRGRVFPPRRRDGFTMVELLVSFAVLILLSMLLLGSLSSFTTVTSTSGQRIETDSLARAVYDQMDFDLNAAVPTGQVPLTFRKNTAATGGGSAPNDSMLFLCRARSTDADSRMAVVGYDIGSDPLSSDTSTVLRHTSPFAWTDDTSTIALHSVADTQPLPGVIRMELGFLIDDKDGTILADPPADTTTIKAVICALATLDAASLGRLSAAEKQSLVSSLTDAADNAPPVSRWSLSDLPDLPSYVRQNIRFHQRYFYLK